MKYGFIYMWISKIDNKKYIGSHYGELTDGYVSSSNYFNEIYNYNPENFERKILTVELSREEALKKEQLLLCNIDAANSSEYYNLHNYSGMGWSHHDNPELAKIYYARISATRKGKPSPHKGKSLWNENNRYKLKIDKWLVKDPNGNIFEIENMLEFCKENNLNPSAMSAVARGKRRIYKNYWCKKLTNTRNIDYEYTEWKSKGHSAKANYGEKNGYAKSITVDGIYYGSMREASEYTGLSMYKLNKLRKQNEE